MLLSVFAHRTVGGKARRQLRHAFPHPLDPCGGNLALVSGIKLQDDLSLEQIVKRVGFDRVSSGIVARFLTIPQRPPHLRPVGFRPPAI